MLISFSVKNFLSFNQAEKLSMVATSERKEKATLTNLKKFRLKILPIAAMYGANASGKSNFIKALHFLQNLVLRSASYQALIPVRPYLFSEASEGNTVFNISFLVSEEIFTYLVELNQKGIVKEVLSQTNSRREVVLYRRENGTVEVGKDLAQAEELKIVARRVGDKTLLLTMLTQMKFDEFLPVYEWFEKKLQIIFPHTSYVGYNQLIDPKSPQSTRSAEILREMGTGINYLSTEPLNISDRLPDSFKEELIASISKEGSQLLKFGDTGDGRLLVSLENGELKFERVVAAHKTNHGAIKTLPLEEESDGSRRFIDLVPSVLGLADKKEHSVYVIDEIDRSLHTDLTKAIVEKFLQTTGPDNNGQLIFSTHDTNLLRRSKLRRDEIWFVRNQSNEGSQLISAAGFEGLRIDSSIQKLYEEGRFGAIPNISGCSLPVIAKQNYQ